MSEDAVLELEKLAALHRGGELSDAEFEQAKRQLLEKGAATDGSTRAEPTADAFAEPPVVTRPVRWREGSRSRGGGIWLAGSWKLTVIVLVAVGCAFGIAALIVAEVAPSTAQWSRGFVCSGNEQLVTNGGVVHSNGGSAQGATHFYCIAAGQTLKGLGLELLSLPEQTGGVLGFSFLFGFLIGAGLIVASLLLLSLRPRARTALT